MADKIPLSSATAIPEDGESSGFNIIGIVHQPSSPSNQTGDSSPEEICVLINGSTETLKLKEGDFLFFTQTAPEEISDSTRGETVTNGTTNDETTASTSTSIPKESILVIRKTSDNERSYLILPLPCTAESPESPQPTPTTPVKPPEIKSIASTISTSSPRHAAGVITSESTSTLLPSNETPVQMNPPIMFHFTFQQYVLSIDGIETILDLALQDYKSGDYITAEGRCTQLLRQQPQNSRLLLLLSAIYYKAGDLDKSEHYSKLAIHSNPGMPEGYSNLANCLRSKGMIQQALESYRHALKLKPTFIDGYLNLAYCLEEAGELSQAADAYSMAIQYDPDLYQVRNDLGNVLRSMGRLKDARKCYMGSIETRTDFGIAWGNLGCVYSDMGDLWLAIHHLEKATSLQPTLINAYVNLGNVLKGGNMFDKAMVCYIRALHLNPLMAEIQASLKEIDVDTWRRDLHIKQFSSLIQLSPEKDSPEVRLALAQCLMEKGLLEDAQKHVEEALRLNPSHKGALKKLGEVKASFRESEFQILTPD